MHDQSERRYYVYAYVTEAEYHALNRAEPYAQATLAETNRYSGEPYSEDDIPTICRDAAIAAGHITVPDDYDLAPLANQNTRNWPFHIRVAIMDHVQRSWHRGADPPTSSEWNNEDDAQDFFSRFPELLAWVQDPSFDIDSAWASRRNPEDAPT